MIDRREERLELARRKSRVETLNFEQEDPYQRLMEMTRGYGPDSCIDAVGAEAHGAGDPEYQQRDADSSEPDRRGCSTR